MANNMGQVSLVIDKLLEKTRLGLQRWNNSVVKSKYQTRIGDFTVEVTGGNQTIGSFHPNASIKITKLTGVTVADAGGMSPSLALASGLSGKDMLSPDSQDALNNLYDMLSDRSDDLNELLDLL